MLANFLNVASLNMRLHGLTECFKWASNFGRQFGHLPKDLATFQHWTKLTVYSAQGKNIVFSRIRMKSRKLIWSYTHLLKFGILFRCTIISILMQMQIFIENDIQFRILDCYNVFHVFFRIKENTTEWLLHLNSSYILLLRSENV